MVRRNWEVYPKNHKIIYTYYWKLRNNPRSRFIIKLDQEIHTATNQLEKFQSSNNLIRLGDANDHSVHVSGAIYLVVNIERILEAARFNIL